MTAANLQPAPAAPEPEYIPLEFIQSLLGEGEVTVTPFTGAPLEIAPDVLDALREWEAAARWELSGDVPSLDPTALRWAAIQFYRACQLLVCRDVPPEVIFRTLEDPCPAPRGPAADFSVDLLFRFLPGLADLARRMAPVDTLVQALEGVARAWPLSSVGIRLEKLPGLETFSGCPALWRLYVDRVTAKHAEDRWRDAAVAAQLRADLGVFPELAPAAAAAVTTPPAILPESSAPAPVSLSA